MSNSEIQMRQLIMSRLIWICAVCKKPIFIACGSERVKAYWPLYILMRLKKRSGEKVWRNKILNILSKIWTDEYEYFSKPALHLQRRVKSETQAAILLNAEMTLSIEKAEKVLSGTEKGFIYWSYNLHVSFENKILTSKREYPVTKTGVALK